MSVSWTLSKPADFERSHPPYLQEVAVPCGNPTPAYEVHAPKCRRARAAQSKVCARGERYGKERRDFVRSVRHGRSRANRGSGARWRCEISTELRHLLADAFGPWMKTKNFHRHTAGRNFRNYRLLLDEHADPIFAMTDDIAEGAGKIGGATLRSIGALSRQQRLRDNHEESVSPHAILGEVRSDNREPTRFLGATHWICEEHNDVATASLIENSDRSDRWPRAWFLSEIVNGQ